MNTSQAAFEEEMKIVFDIPPAYFRHAFKRDADSPDRYWNLEMQNAWIGWQAAMRQAVPDTHVVVPKEPTEEMRQAVYMALHYYMNTQNPNEWEATDNAIAVMIEAGQAKEPAL